ncbi:uncharacterized protein LOC143562793 isoform X2 [Bidens hawaiensis]|uniref:uncharacterized protein LOC143562793 isoform X2 n=1 Tax=Bidens hawaiensis TaxID=980011 RepID=UPI00404B4C1C
MQLQARLYELEDRLDSLSLDRKELQEHIRFAVNEHDMVEMMLGELEEEHEEAIHKIKLLETELKDLKDENHRLKEVNGKSQWDTDILMRKDVSDDVYKGKLDANDSVKNINESMYLDNTFGQKREFAVSQSVFSSMLSLLVGMVIWEAQEPCMPLVTALFMVVGMSLKSVVQFFSTIKNKPASDAVALLSLNWFILGALTYPTLPKVAHLSAPLLTKSLGWIWCQLQDLIGVNEGS